MTTQAVILAAGMGTRLGRPWPKPLTPLADGRTEVKYAIEIEFNIPVPGFVLNQLVKGSIPSMIRSFEKQAKAGN